MTPREIDIVAELDHRTVVGLEVKAGGGPSRHDARHLIWLRDQLGDQFAGGVVLHTGEFVYPLDDRIAARSPASGTDHPHPPDRRVPDPRSTVTRSGWAIAHGS